MTNVLAAALIAVVAAGIGVAAWRRGRRPTRVCINCGRIDCPGCAYRMPPGAGAL